MARGVQSTALPRRSRNYDVDVEGSGDITSMCIYVESVEVLEFPKLTVTFNTHEKKIFDVSVKRGVKIGSLKPLRLFIQNF